MNDLLLAEGVEAAEAVEALARETDPAYLRVFINRPSMAESLRRAGYPLELPGWSTFMVKSLEQGLRTDDFRRLFGIGTERFMISPLDIT